MLLNRRTKEDKPYTMNIDYHNLVNDAMLGIMRRILEQVRDYGLEDEHGLYINFDTNHSETVISKRLKVQYPEEMTIILQYQYKNLIVTADYFSVTLTFNDISETIKVPFKALINFSDPLMDFSLEFNDLEDILPENNDGDGPPKQVEEPKENITAKPIAEVISLAEFRSKK